MKNRRNIWVLILVVFFHLNSVIAQDFKSIGYLPTYRFNFIDKIELHRLTHLNIAFANPDAGGNLSTNGVSINPIVQKAHDADLKVFIALAGAAAQLSDWEDWIAPDQRSSFVSRIVDYVTQYELQGVDVDLEWGNVNDDYSGFVLELKDSLHKYNYELSAALPGLYRYPEITDEALAAFDWVNLMVYDLTGPWAPNNPGPHSPYSMATGSIDYWISNGLEKNRMTLGVPFYGYNFTDQSNVFAVTFAQMVNMDTAFAQVDQVGETYYNGLPIITQKTILALNEVSGIMIWELGQDHFGAFSLLTRMNETIEASNTTLVAEVEEFKSLTVFPNPTKDFVKVKAGNLKNINISLYTATGQRLETSRYKTHDDFLIGLQNYPKGLYFLSVESEKSVRNIKIIKI